MPSKAADNCDLLAAVLSVCGDVHVGLAHCVETGLQTHHNELTHWPQETADIVDFFADEAVTSGNFFAMIILLLTSSYSSYSILPAFLSYFYFCWHLSC